MRSGRKSIGVNGGGIRFLPEVERGSSSGRMGGIVVSRDNRASLPAELKSKHPLSSTLALCR